MSFNLRFGRQFEIYHDHDYLQHAQEVTNFKTSLPIDSRDLESSENATNPKFSG